MRDEAFEKNPKLNELDFAVRVDQQGNLLRDFHIAQKYTERVILIEVCYESVVENAVFVVALSPYR